MNEFIRITDPMGKEYLVRRSRIEFIARCSEHGKPAGGWWVCFMHQNINIDEQEGRRLIALLDPEEETQS